VAETGSSTSTSTSSTDPDVDRTPASKRKAGCSFSDILTQRDVLSLILSCLTTADALQGLGEADRSARAAVDGALTRVAVTGVPVTSLAQRFPILSELVIVRLKRFSSVDALLGGDLPSRLVALRIDDASASSRLTRVFFDYDWPRLTRFEPECLEPYITHPQAQALACVETARLNQQCSYSSLAKALRLGCLPRLRTLLTNPGHWLSYFPNLDAAGDVAEVFGDRNVQVMMIMTMMMINAAADNDDNVDRPGQAAGDVQGVLA
jgi:hypothetical protein